ncbi:unnamed protein product [Linum tenue]|uniref:Uncharacterized protein n=1 Tax=Linum tenue TaxID=586396 RepID=A0AAV0IW51_9ROSI|nr:unnamed protein product [Linum tenue]
MNLTRKSGIINALRMLYWSNNYIQEIRTVLVAGNRLPKTGRKRCTCCQNIRAINIAESHWRGHAKAKVVDGWRIYPVQRILFYLKALFGHCEPSPDNLHIRGLIYCHPCTMNLTRKSDIINRLRMLYWSNKDIQEVLEQLSSRGIDYQRLVANVEPVARISGRLISQNLIGEVTQGPKLWTDGEFIRFSAFYSTSEPYLVIVREFLWRKKDGQRLSYSLTFSAIFCKLP